MQKNAWVVKVEEASELRWAQETLRNELERWQRGYRARRVELKDLLEGTLEKLHGWGVRLAHGGTVGTRYQYPAQTTVAALAWARAAEGFPLVVALAAARESTKGYRSALEEQAGTAVSSLRSALPESLREPEEAREIGDVKLVKRVLSRRWERVVVGPLSLELARRMEDFASHEALAKHLAFLTGTEPRLWRWALKGKNRDKVLAELALAQLGR